VDDGSAILIPLFGFTDDEEEAADEGAPAVDASGQYAFNSDCKLMEISIWWLYQLTFPSQTVAAAPQGGFAFGGQ
jgi:hypothetical protein